MQGRRKHEENTGLDKIYGINNRYNHNRRKKNRYCRGSRRKTYIWNLKNIEKTIEGGSSRIKREERVKWGVNNT